MNGWSWLLLALNRVRRGECCYCHLDHVDLLIPLMRRNRQPLKWTMVGPFCVSSTTWSDEGTVNSLDVRMCACPVSALSKLLVSSSSPPDIDVYTCEREEGWSKQSNAEISVHESRWLNTCQFISYSRTWTKKRHVRLKWHEFMFIYAWFQVEWLDSSSDAFSA